MKLKRGDNPSVFDVEVVSRDGAALRIRVGDKTITANFVPSADGSAVLTLDGRRYHIFGARRKDSTIVSVGPASFEFKSVDDTIRLRARGLAASEITAPMPGKVLSVIVKVGDLVEAGQALVVIEAMKMETTLAAESAALVKRVLVKAGDTVDHGALLIELSPPVDPPASSAPGAEPRDS